MIQPRILNQPVKRVHTEVLAAGIFEDVRPLRGPAEEVDWLHGGLLSRLICEGRVTGKQGEAVLLATQAKIPASKVLIIGLGKRALFDHAALRRSLELTCNKLLQLKARRCVAEVFGIGQCPLETAEVTRDIVSVLKNNPDLSEMDLSFLVHNEGKAQQVRRDLSATAVAR